LEYAERAVLWNAVEKVEKAKNSQLARDVALALPAELTLEQNHILVRTYCQQQFVDKGMCADICIHDKGDGNPHTHVMLTMRPLDEDETWGGKQKKEYILDRGGNKIYDKKKRQYKCKSIPATDWNEHTKAEVWRAAWTEAVNATLERYGEKGRVDHRSFKRQGKEELPTVHLGVNTAQMERKSVVTERGNINREVIIFNAKLKKLETEIDELKDWLKTELKKDEPPNLVHIIERVLVRMDEKRKASPYPTRDDSGIYVETLNFLNEHGIETMDDFKEKAAGLRSGYQVEKFARMQNRLIIILQNESRRVQKEQQGQRQPRSRGMER
jgi:hypothetical protein